jgi:hypothetical protein
VRYNLGMAYLKLGRTEEARGQLELAAAGHQRLPGVAEVRAALEGL